ncbi:hypothetical protein [Archaeoglobus sp.]
MVHEKVLKAFDGTLETQPLEVTVKLGERKKKIFIGMGEIRVPLIKSIENVDNLEREYECRIVRRGNVYVVTPNVVSEIIEKEGVLSSACEEHRKKLREWMVNHGGYVIKHLVGLE